DIARERGLTVDVAGFEAAMEQQRETARAAGEFGGGVQLPAELVATLAPPVFLGCDGLEAAGLKIAALLSDGGPADSVAVGGDATVLADRTPVYAESGGQVGDTGVLEGEGAKLQVTDSQKFAGQFHGHFARVVEGGLNTGQFLRGAVDGDRRRAIVLNHS